MTECVLTGLCQSRELFSSSNRFKSNLRSAFNDLRLKFILYMTSKSQTFDLLHYNSRNFEQNSAQESLQVKNDQKRSQNSIDFRPKCPVTGRTIQILTQVPDGLVQTVIRNSDCNGLSFRNFELIIGTQLSTYSTRNKRVRHM